MGLGVGLGQLVGLARESRRLADDRGPLLVVGPMADVLARSLADGAADPGTVRTTADAGAAAAVVVVVAGQMGDEELRAAREASRAHVPVVAVQILGDSDDVPYVLAEHVVVVAPGEGFPVEQIAAALAAALGGDGVALAARLPALREAVEAWLFRRAVARSAVIGAAPWSSQHQFPLLTLGQARMLMEMDAAAGRSRSGDPQETAATVGLPLATAVTTGLLARAAFRRGPFRGRIAAAAVAAAGTVAARMLGRVVSSRR